MVVQPPAGLGIAEAPLCAFLFHRVSGLDMLGPINPEAVWPHKATSAKRAETVAIPLVFSSSLSLSLSTAVDPDPGTLILLVFGIPYTQGTKQCPPARGCVEEGLVAHAGAIWLKGWIEMWRRARRVHAPPLLPRT